MRKKPLSERIDRITRKFSRENRKKVKTERGEAEASTPAQDQPQTATLAEAWDATQVCCPIPPRNPGGWNL